MRDFVIFLGIIAVASLTFWLGRDSAPHCPECPRPVCKERPRIWLGKEECYRGCRATERMEKVK